LILFGKGPGKKGRETPYEMNGVMERRKPDSSGEGRGEGVYRTEGKKRWSPQKVGRAKDIVGQCSQSDGSLGKEG